MNELISFPLRLHMVDNFIKFYTVVWSAISFDDIHCWSFEIEFLLNQVEGESPFLKLLKTNCEADKNKVHLIVFQTW